MDITLAQSLLQQQVTNPFNIANFASLAATNPELYKRMAGNAFFTAATVQRQALLRGYPQLSGLAYSNLPLGVVTSINGSLRGVGEMAGMASHAGTTPMDRRRDAAAADAILIDVQTPVYAGPFDLLLHLILKEQVDL